MAALFAGIAAVLAGSHGVVALARRGIAMAAASCETFRGALLDSARAEELLEEASADSALP